MMIETKNGGSFRLFLGCFIALVATAFGFAVRGAVLQDLALELKLNNEQLGYLGGAGLYPFAISIILLSLVIDKVGYGPLMVFAFFGHTVSALMTIFATSFEMLYFGTFLFALSNGTVEAVINPVVASMYDKNKTHWLNILHAGWPGGLVLGGLLAIGVSMLGGVNGGSTWRWQMALVLLPTAVYGILLLGQKFPVQERVRAGVSYMDMLREFGWGSGYICFFLLIAGINQILVVTGIEGLSMRNTALVAIAPTVLFALVVKKFGRPMFVFMLLIMFLLATTELGTDSWIADIMRSVLKNATLGTLFLVYTSFIMFVLRFFAGPIVHRISPLGLLALCAGIASIGLLWLSAAGNAALMLFLAATLYGFGKTFFWPTTLGVVSEQYPKGGALMLNAIAGVGMLAVGTLGNPAIGYMQDRAFDKQMNERSNEIYQKVVSVNKESMFKVFGEPKTLDQQKYEILSQSEKDTVDEEVVKAKQGTLAKVAILPAIMLICYLALIVFYRSRGGYKAEVLTGGAGEYKEYAAPADV
jgi:MFS family permease